MSSRVYRGPVNREETGAHIGERAGAIKKERSKERSQGCAGSVCRYAGVASDAGGTMQQLEHTGELGNPGNRRVEAVVQTLAALGSHGDSLAEVAHDARNMVTALGLYCDLLEEPGVLAVPFAHYSSELRLVAAASRRLVEKLVALDVQAECEQLRKAGGDGAQHEDEADADGWTDSGLPAPALRRALDQSLDRTLGGMQAGEASPAAQAVRSRRWDSIFAEPINNLAGEVAANRNLLAALAGSGIVVTVDAEGGGVSVHLTAEDLTRLLVNMVKNAAEAMPSGGRVLIGLREQGPGWVLLTVEDTGPGIPTELLGRVFESGFTTHSRVPTSSGGWPAAHRGLGLAITRSIVETAGGRITAHNRTGPSRTGPNQAGARFEIELPVRSF